ncbi:MAG: hypothetical protein P8107_10630, partial [Spirochaetia bacterium]
MNWLDKFKYNPIQPLIKSQNTALIYFTNRDLLGKKVSSVDRLRELTEVNEIIKKQTPDGFW